VRNLPGADNLVRIGMGFTVRAVKYSKSIIEFLSKIGFEFEQKIYVHRIPFRVLAGGNLTSKISNKYSVSDH